MMPIFYEAELIARVPVEFTDREGLTVRYNELYFLISDEEGNEKVIKFNSKLDTSAFKKGNDVVLELEIDPTGNRKPKLVSIKSK